MFVPLSPAGIRLTSTLSHGGERGQLNLRRLLMVGMNTLAEPLCISPWTGEGKDSRPPFASQKGKG